MRAAVVNYIKEWVVVDSGVGRPYPIHVNSFDTNGTIQRYYWNEQATFDSSSGYTTKTSSNILTTRTIGAGDLIVPIKMWIYGRDDDGLTSGNRFTVYPDSAPPAPDVVSASGDGGMKIMWSGKDVKDGDATQYRILLKQGGSPDSTNIVQDFKAGAQYLPGDNGYQFKWDFTTGTSGSSYKFKVIAMDSRGTQSSSVEGPFIYP